MPAADEDQALTPTVRQWHWVGDVNLGARNDGYVGAKLMEFHTIKGFHRYFSDNKRKVEEDDSEIGMLLIKVLHCQPRMWGLLGTHVIALVTNQISPDEMAEMTQASRRVEEEMKVWREQQEASKYEDRRIKVMADEEVRRLARLGQHCEAAHKHQGMKAIKGDGGK